MNNKPYCNNDEERNSQENISNIAPDIIKSTIEAYKKRDYEMWLIERFEFCLQHRLWGTYIL